MQAIAEPAGSAPSASRKNTLEAAGWVLIALAGCGYLVQCFTLLRLTPDAIIYLSMAASASEGRGFTYHGGPAGYPSGYPALIHFMMRMGLGTSLFLNFLNLGALVVCAFALLGIARMRNDARIALPALIAVLFSFVVIKHAVIPLTDTTFLAVTALSIWLAETGVELKSGRMSVWVWLAAISLAFVSVFLRVVGVITVPVLLFEWYRADLRTKLAINWRVVTGLALAAIGIFLVAFQWIFHLQVGTSSGSQIPQHLKILAHKRILDVVRPHLEELGSLALNIPRSTLPHAALIFLIAGIAITVMIAGELVSSRRQWRPSRTYLVCYAATIMLWPETPDPRFWLPVVPLLALEALRGIARVPFLSAPTARIAGRGYAVCFILLGIGAISYSVRITVSRSAFLSAPLAATWKQSYEAWLQPANTPIAGVDWEVLSLLHKFGGVTR